MADAIDNLAQDLNQVNPSVDAMYPLGYENYYIPRPDDFGVPQELNQTGDRWIWDARNPQWGYYKYAQNLSNPSTLGTGTEIDFNTPDDPTIRTNIGNTDEQDAFVKTGIGTTLDPNTKDRGVSTGIGTALDPMTEDKYRFTGLIPPDKAGTFIGVQYLDPSEAAVTTAGQIPSSLPEEFITRGETVKIPGRGLPDYRQIIDTDGNISYINNETGRVDFTVPGVKGYPGVPDLSENPNLKLPFISTKTTDTSVGSMPFTPTPVESYQSVGADERTTASVGGFDNTGGDVTVGPGVAGPSVDDTIRFNPDYKPKPEVQPGDEFKDSPYRIFDPTGKDDKLADYTSPTGEVFPTDQNGYKWNYKTQQFDCVGGKCSEKNPVEDTTKPPVVTTPPGGGTKPPGGGGQPGGGTPGGGPPGGGTPGRGPTPLPPREPVTPLVRREVVIPTKGTKEVPLPDRQADPFAKLYADLLANSQQQQDQYRYINYDPDQIMNAAMSGFRRRGAMRSLQGY